VISRALGAEETVEVDLKTVAIPEGTCFLLCSDGITRHVPDQELKELLIGDDDLASVCAELKRRCHERGAEDNLTAVIVRLGDAPPERRELLEGRTLSLDGPAAVQSGDREKTTFAGNLDLTEDALVPPSRILIPAPTATLDANQTIAQERPLNISDSVRSKGAGNEFKRFLIFLLFLAGIAAAFYGGTRYKGPLPFGLRHASEIPPVSQSAPAPDESLLKFEKARREVDRAPAEWLAKELPKELTAQKIAGALESNDPEFLYLYGRALLLTGKNDEAANAFEQSIARAEQSPSTTNATVRKEAALAMAAVSLKSKKEIERALKRFEEMVAKPAGQ
jgi:tetratricopeptide (TPR) repeat protein